MTIVAVESRSGGGVEARFDPREPLPRLANHHAGRMSELVPIGGWRSQGGRPGALLHTSLQDASS